MGIGRAIRLGLFREEMEGLIKGLVLITLPGVGKVRKPKTFLALALKGLRARPPQNTPGREELAQGFLSTLTSKAAWHSEPLAIGDQTQTTQGGQSPKSTWVFTCHMLCVPPFSQGSRGEPFSGHLVICTGSI